MTMDNPITATSVKNEIKKIEVMKTIRKIRHAIGVTRLGNFSKYVATIFLPELPTFLGNFCQGVIIFGKLL